MEYWNFIDDDIYAAEYVDEGDLSPDVLPENYTSPEQQQPVYIQQETEDDSTN